jgi:hypothetical protein
MLMRIIWWLVALQNPSHSKHIACFIFHRLYICVEGATIIIWARFIYIDILVRNPYKGKKLYIKECEKRKQRGGKEAAGGDW